MKVCLTFYRSVPSKKQSEIVCIESPSTTKPFFIQNLLFYNDENWEAEEKVVSAPFYISFKFPWIFKIFGYRFRSGNHKFLTRWEISGGINYHGKNDYQWTVLDEKKNNSALSNSNAEKSFKIENEKFFDCFGIRMKKRIFSKCD
jgi:hypothetical protein